MKGKKAEIFREKNITKLYDFLFVRFDSNQRVLSTLKAKNGTQDDASQNVYLKGKVVFINEDNSKLETDSLTYIKAENKVKTNDRVKITRSNGDIIRGKGLIADMSLKKMEILSQVEGNSAGR